MRLSLMRGGWKILALSTMAAMGMLVTAAYAQAEPIATINITPGAIVWNPTGKYESLNLRVATPDGEVVSKDFSGSQAVSLSPPTPDGSYTYELRATPIIDTAIKQTLANARAQGNDEAVGRDLRKRNVIPSEPLALSGTFAVANGQFVVPVEEK